MPKPKSAVVDCILTSSFKAPDKNLPNLGNLATAAPVPIPPVANSKAANSRSVGTKPPVAVAVISDKPISKFSSWAFVSFIGSALPDLTLSELLTIDTVCFI